MSSDAGSNKGGGNPSDGSLHRFPFAVLSDLTDRMTVSDIDAAMRAIDGRSSAIPSHVGPAILNTTPEFERRGAGMRHEPLQPNY